MTDTFYDAANPPVQALCDSDATGICCYTDGNYGYDPDDIKQFVDAGKMIVANHENAENELYGGYNAGVNAAKKAMAAVAKWPVKPTGIYYSVDLSVNPNSKDYAAVLQAFDGINDVQNGEYTSATYAEGALIATLAQMGLTQAGGWLSASTSYPRYNRNSPYVAVWQMVGSDIPGTDKNIVTQLDQMALWRPNVPPPVIRKETKMFFSYTKFPDGTSQGWVVTDTARFSVLTPPATDPGPGQVMPRWDLDYSVLSAIPVFPAAWGSGGSTIDPLHPLSGLKLDINGTGVFVPSAEVPAALAADAPKLGG